MINTPRTNALSNDPTIERRDVPNRVWREMAALERENAELAEALRELVGVVGSTVDYTVEQDMQALEFDVLDEARVKALAVLAKRGKGAT